MTTKELLKTKISYYSNVKYSNSYKDITLYDWITYYSIKYKPVIDKVRELYDTHKALGKQMKADNLPVVTITGVFHEYRRIDLVSHINPILLIDIDRDDNLDIEDWDELKKKVASLPYVFLTSYSVSGKGIYCLVYFDEKLDHRLVFNALYEDFKQMGIIIDKCCKDITRTRFVSYDDNMLIRQNEVQQYNKTLDNYINQNYVQLGTLRAEDDFIVASIYYLIKECNYRADDYYDWLKDGFRLATFGEAGHALFRLLSMKSSNYNEQYMEEKFKECARTTKYSKDCLVYYFGVLKKKLGPNWKDKIYSKTYVH